MSNCMPICLEARVSKCVTAPLKFWNIWRWSSDVINATTHDKPQEKLKQRCRITTGFLSTVRCSSLALKNAVFWDVAPCRYCVNRRFGGTYRLHLPGRKTRERGTSVSRWLLHNTQYLHCATSQKTAFFSHRRETLKSSLVLVSC
jgi:hypothetical protein